MINIYSGLFMPNAKKCFNVPDKIKKGTLACKCGDEYNMQKSGYVLLLRLIAQENIKESLCYAKQIKPKSNKTNKLISDCVAITWYVQQNVKVRNRTLYYSNKVKSKGLIVLQNALFQI